VYKELRKAGIKVEYIEMPGGKHSICKEAYGRDDFMSWIFKQKR
jgi:acetyl esterase/lipase